MDATSVQRKVTVACPFCGRLNRVDMARAADRPKCGECSRPILLDRPLSLSDADFDRVIADAQVPVLVDFYADWCGPCKMMAPHFETAARQLPDVRFVKVDSDASPRASAQYAIRSIPTLIIFNKGAEVARQSGALPAGELARWVGRHVGQTPAGSV